MVSRVLVRRQPRRSRPERNAKEEDEPSLGNVSVLMSEILSHSALSGLPFVRSSTVWSVWGKPRVQRTRREAEA